MNDREIPAEKPNLFNMEHYQAFLETMKLAQSLGRENIALRGYIDKLKDNEKAAPTLTQGADGESLRPVAIYQVLSQVFSMTACWEDVPKEFYDRQHPIQRRIVYATRDAAPK